MMELEITKRQKAFLSATADEVLFGGAAGGGKSYGQLIDALLYALRYQKSKQLILRRTFPDLERSLILVSLGLFPQGICKYNSATHRWQFVNGSLIEFGYCDSEKDVYRYQGAEYDVIRFDELTHFTESMYIYLISRLRGANDYPKQIKSSTNPGGVGHYWVKKRFIDIGEADVLHDTPNGSRVFLPSKVQDNHFLLRKDPRYIKRLENLSEKDRRALLLGEWDIFEGQYFTEWNRDVHICKAFTTPTWWRYYVTMDYGLDMLAAYLIAVDEHAMAYVVREIYEGRDAGEGCDGLIISEAAKRVKALGDGVHVSDYLAPPDLWNRRQETGKSVADIFAEHGIFLTQSSNDRVGGWLAVKEWLRVFEDEQGIKVAKLRIFPYCVNLIRCLPQLQYDEKKPSDCAVTPHEITHGPDAIRGFCVYWTGKSAGEPRAPRQKKLIEKLEGKRVRVIL